MGAKLGKAKTKTSDSNFSYSQQHPLNTRRSSSSCCTTLPPTSNQYLNINKKGSRPIARSQDSQYTVSTQRSSQYTNMNISSRRDHLRNLSSISSRESSQQLVQSQNSPSNVKDERMLEAEKILSEIAKDYAAKRAAGLVPTVPEPARKILWEELALNERTRAGKRGKCIFGRDGQPNDMCRCKCYMKKRGAHKQQNGSILCEECGHGAPWHRLIGGNMAMPSTLRSLPKSNASLSQTSSILHPSMILSSVGSVIRRSSATSSNVNRRTSDAISSSHYSSSYYDSDEDDEDDEDIANELAIPSTMMMPQQNPPFGMHGINVYNAQNGVCPYVLGSPKAGQGMDKVALITAHPIDGQYMPRRTSSNTNGHLPPRGDGYTSGRDDRSSIYSNVSSNSQSNFGFPPRLSSASNKLQELLQAIKKYRAMGLNEDEIEARIRIDFPPLPDRSSIGQSSDVPMNEDVIERSNLSNNSRLMSM